MQTVTFSNGVKVINCTPYDIIYIDKGRNVRVPVSGIVIYADRVTKEVGDIFITQRYEGNDHGWDNISEIKGDDPDVLILGTIKAAEAYPRQVVTPVPLKGYDKSAPEDKRMDPGRYITF